MEQPPTTQVLIEWNSLYSRKNRLQLRTHRTYKILIDNKDNKDTLHGNLNITTLQQNMTDVHTHNGHTVHTKCQGQGVRVFSRLVSGVQFLFPQLTMVLTLEMLLTITMLLQYMQLMRLHYHVYSLWRLQRQTVGLMWSRSFASRAVGQLFDVDWTALAPSRYSHCLNFTMNVTVQSRQTKSTLWLTFSLLKTFFRIVCSMEYMILNKAFNRLKGQPKCALCLARLCNYIHRKIQTVRVLQALKRSGLHQIHVVHYHMQFN